MIFLRLSAVMAKIGLQRSAIYARIARGQFPRPIKIGASSVWLESTVEAWMRHVRRHGEPPPGTYGPTP